MKNRIILIIAGLCFSLSVSTSHAATDLWHIYQTALDNDPIYKAALAQEMAAAEQYPQARAVLLPQINFVGSGALSKKKLNGIAVGQLHPGYTETTQSERTLGFDLSLTQSIFNIGYWQNLSAAKNTVKSSVATYNAAAQDLMTRVAQAYFNVLQARDVLRFTGSEKRAFYEEYIRAEQSFKVGIKTITDVYNAKAAYDQSIADYVTSKNDLSNKREDLRVITGVYHADLAPLKVKIPLVSPSPSDINKWVETAIHQNWSLVAARYTTLSAHKTAQAAYAGHYPTLDFSAKYDNQYTQNFDIGGYRVRGPQGELDLTLPIFSGGEVSSKAREAVANYEYSSDQQDGNYRQVISFTRKSYLGVLTGIATVKATKQAIISNQSSLEGMREGYKVGTRTMVDVLIGQKTLYESQKDYAISRYNYIMSGVFLKNAAGTLSEGDIQEMNRWLKTSAHRYSTHRMQHSVNVKPVMHPRKINQVVQSAYYVQLGIYRHRLGAEQVMKHAKRVTKTPCHVYAKPRNKTVFYYVQVGPVRNGNTAKQLRHDLEQAGFSKPLVVKRYG